MGIHIRMISNHIQGCCIQDHIYSKHQPLAQHQQISFHNIHKLGIHMIRNHIQECCIQDHIRSRHQPLAQHQQISFHNIHKLDIHMICNHIQECCIQDRIHSRHRHQPQQMLEQHSRPLKETRACCLSEFMIQTPM